MATDMTPARDNILQQALALTAADRAYLADELERSLPDEGFVAEDIAAAWSAEIDRRIAAYDAGHAKSMDFGEAISLMRRTLAERRSKQDPS